MNTFQESPAASRVFFSRLLDYAGLFPPAQLPMEQAVANYVHYRQSAHAWLLGRFICPAARLQELLPLREQLGPASLSIIGRGGKDAREFFDNVRADLADLRNFRDQRGAAVAEAYEVRLPTSLVQSPRSNQLSALVGTVAYLIESSGLPPLAPFFECPVLEPTAIEALVQVLLADRQTTEARARRVCGPLGWKLRCGGQEPAAFPSPRQVALVLAGCCAGGIPWKATAGLHHPLRHFDVKLGTLMHGFINVFGAGVLAHAGRLDVAEMEAMLLDEDATQFEFTDAGFRWKDHLATPQQIEAARRHLVTSFGTCSFEEPRDDLVRLGWIA